MKLAPYTLFIIFLAQAFSVPTLHEDLYLIDYTIVNPYDFPVKIERHGTLYGDVVGDILCTLNGTRLPYEGYYGSYDESDPFFVLKPGEKKTTRFYLEEYFNMTLPGEYTVWFKSQVRNSWFSFGYDLLSLQLDRTKSVRKEQEDPKPFSFSQFLYTVLGYMPQKYVGESNKFTIFKNKTGSLFEEMAKEEEANYDYGYTVDEKNDEKEFESSIDL